MRLYTDQLERIDHTARWAAGVLTGGGVGAAYVMLGREALVALARRPLLVTLALAAVVISLVFLYLLSRWLLRFAHGVLIRRVAPAQIARHYQPLIEQLLSEAPHPGEPRLISELLARKRVAALSRWDLLSALRGHVTILRRRASPSPSPLLQTLNALTDRWISRGVLTADTYSPGPLRYADPIYGTIEFLPAFSPLQKHPLMQRLQEIRQLTFAFPVYPGATHTRFSHSVGVAHLARTALGPVLDRNRVYRDDGHSEINLPTSDRERLVSLVTIAGLVHDIAHGPLGHALDRFFGTKFLGGIPSADKGFIGKILRDHLAQAISAVPGASVDDVLLILAGQAHQLFGWHNFAAQLFDSGLDVDRMDYLQRDAHFTGHREGLFDPEALFSAIRPFEKEGKIHLAFDIAFLNHVEQFVYGRDAMYLRCYEHPAKTVSEWLAMRAVKKLFEDNSSLIDNIDSFILLTDSQLLELVSLATPQDSVPRSILQALFRGDGVNFRQVASVRFEEYALTDRLSQLINAFMVKSGTLLDVTEELERVIAREAGVEQQDLVLMCPLPNAIDEREMDVGILRKKAGGYEHIPIFGDERREAPSELLRRQRVLEYEEALAVRTLEELKAKKPTGLSFLGIVRKARAKLRLFLHLRRLPVEARVREAFYNLGVRPEFRE